MKFSGNSTVRLIPSALMSVLLAACGGGGGGSSGGSGGGATSITIGGTVSGLTGSGLVLKDNGGDSLAISANGTFRFSASLASGSSYSVTVAGQPRSPMQLCAVTGGSGAAGSTNVSSVTVTCSAPTAVAHIYPIGATDLDWDSHGSTLYVALGSAAPTGANSVAVVDPASGVVGATAGAGMTPTVLRVSDDGTLLYVGSTSSSNIQRFRLPGLASDISIPLGSIPPDGPGSPIATQALEVKPGTAHTIAVSRFNPTVTVSMDLAIFDDATMRGAPGATTAPNNPFLLAWSSDGARVFGADPQTSPPSIATYDVSTAGAAYESKVSNVAPGNSGISYLKGQLYLGSGIVLDPTTQNAVGSVTANGAPVVDADNGILFVVQTDAVQNATLVAFDLTRFVPIGKLPLGVLTSVYPQPAVKHAIRFGNDGLALVTGGGELVIVEHVLSLPDPALTGAGQLLSAVAGSTSYSVYDLPAKSLVWSADQNLLYVSLPSSASGNGNSIAAFDPSTGVIKSSAFVGSEPSHLALSSDGGTLYAALGGASEVAQVSVPTLAPGPTLLLGADSFLGANYPSVVEVAPGRSTTLAVIRVNNYGTNSSIAIYDGATMRSATASSDFDLDLQWGADASVLYRLSGSSGTYVEPLSVDASGVSNSPITIRSLFGAIPHGIHFANALLYADDGTIYDPASTTVRASIAGGSYPVMAVDTASGLGFFLSRNTASTGLMLAAVDLVHGNTVSKLLMPDVAGLPLQITRWGNDGVAFATTGGQLVVVRGSVVTKPAPANPCGAAAGTTLTSAGPQAVNFSSALIAAGASDIVSEPHSGLLYASIASATSPNLNCIVPLMPATGALGAGVFAGSRPGPLAVSDDGSILYSALSGANSIERFNLPSLTHDISIGVVPAALAGTQPLAADIDVAPGASHTIAVALMVTYQNPGGQGIAIFDNGTPRPAFFNGTGVGAVQWAATPSTVYGYDDSAGTFDLYSIPITGNGVGTPSSTTAALQQFGGRIHRFGSLIYGDNGQVINPATSTLAGSFSIGAPFTPVPRSVMTADVALGTAYLAYDDETTGILSVQAFSLANYTSLRTVSLGALTGAPTRMVRWGADGLAIVLDSGAILLLSGTFVTG